MTWLRVAIVLVIVTFLVFAWALCRIAADADERTRDLSRRNEPPFPTPKR